MENEEDVILSVSDIQKIFNCGKNQAYEIIRIKGFPVMKIGRKHYIYKKAFIKWLENNKDKKILK